MYAQNPCCAYIFCSIIIETRPTEDKNYLIVSGCQCALCILPTQTISILELTLIDNQIDTNCFKKTFNMKPTHFVKITIPCQSAEEMLQAKEAVLFHLETLNPEFTTKGTTLTAKVVPLDPKLFYPDEACDIIRQTLAQSLTFNHSWTCTLHTQSLN